MPPYQPRSGRQVQMNWTKNWHSSSWQEGQERQDRHDSSGYWKWQPQDWEEEDWPEEGDDWEEAEEGYEEEWSNWQDRGGQRSQGKGWSQNRRSWKGKGGKGQGRHHHNNNRGFRGNNQRGKKWVKKGEPEAYQEELNGKTGANTIEVDWTPPVKEDEAPKEVVRQLSPVRGPVGRGRQNTLPAWMTKAQAAPNPCIPDQGDGTRPLALTNEASASADADEDTAPVFAEPREKSPSPVRGPAGRGRGSTLPAWMTQGVGKTATAEIDKAPKIPVQDKEHEERLAAMDEIFAERNGNEQKSREVVQKTLAIEDMDAAAPPDTVFNVRRGGKPAKALTLTERPTLTPRVQHPWQKSTEEPEPWEEDAEMPEASLEPWEQEEDWEEQIEQPQASSWKGHGQNNQNRPWRLQHSQHPQYAQHGKSWQKPQEWSGKHSEEWSGKHSEEWSGKHSEEWSSSSWGWNKKPQNQNWGKRKWENHDNYNKKWQNQEKWDKDNSWDQSADAVEDQVEEGWDEDFEPEEDEESSWKRPKTELGVPKAFQRLRLPPDAPVRSSLALMPAAKLLPPPPLHTLHDEAMMSMPDEALLSLSNESWSPPRGPRQHHPQHIPPPPKHPAPMAIGAAPPAPEFDEVAEATRQATPKYAEPRPPFHPKSSAQPMPFAFGDGAPPSGLALASPKLPPVPPVPRPRSDRFVDELEGQWQLQAQRPKQPSVACDDLTELDRLMADYGESMEYFPEAPPRTSFIQAEPAESVHAPSAQAFSVSPEQEAPENYEQQCLASIAQKRKQLREEAQERQRAQEEERLESERQEQENMRRVCELTALDRMMAKDDQNTEYLLEARPPPPPPPPPSLVQAEPAESVQAPSGSPEQEAMEDYQTRGLLGAIQEKKRFLEEKERAKEEERLKKERQEQETMRRFNEELQREEKQKAEDEKKKQAEIAAKKREEDRKELMRREEERKEEQRKKEEQERLSKQIQEELQRQTAITAAEIARAEAKKKEEEAKRLQALRQELPAHAQQETNGISGPSLSSIVNDQIQHTADQLRVFQAQQTQQMLAQQAQMQMQQQQLLQQEQQMYPTGQTGFQNNLQQGFQPQQTFQAANMASNISSNSNCLLPQNQQFQLHQQQQQQQQVYMSQSSLQPMGSQYQPSLQPQFQQQMYQQQQFQQPQFQQLQQQQFGQSTLSQQQYMQMQQQQQLQLQQQQQLQQQAFMQQQQPRMY